MTTYLLLALTDDGRVEAFNAPDVFIDKDVFSLYEPPVRSDSHYSKFEVAGYSIYVCHKEHDNG